jgi:hypothetical protein
MVKKRGIEVTGGMLGGGWERKRKLSMLSMMM